MKSNSTTTVVIKPDNNIFDYGYDWFIINNKSEYWRKFEIKENKEDIAKYKELFGNIFE